LRVDNKGEGGILALVTLLRGASPAVKGGVILTMGLIGASLLYGDSLITPVISVLSAVEGLNVATHFFKPYIVPIAVAVLAGLFLFQKHGSGKIGAIFGPVMILWFLVLAALGLSSIAKGTGVLAAVNPAHAVRFIVENKLMAFFTLGSVFLTLTGAEALYADMGHFGKSPIRKGWFLLVFPALLLNYFGQGALLIRDPAMIDNLFYRLAPAWAVIPLVVLATVATVIASQAVISSAFSLTKQAIQLGYCPRLSILHTSDEAIGQVYIPAVNGMLFVGSVLLVLGFKASGNLSGAYGVAVSMTMLITTLLLFMVFVRLWKWPVIAALPLTLLFLMFDVSFFTSNLTKVANGGWITLLVAGSVFTLMVTWHKGREVLRKTIAGENLPEDLFQEEIASSRPARVPGTAVFLSGSRQGIPRTFLHNFKHNKIIHETVVLLTVVTEEVPAVDRSKRIVHTLWGNGFHRIELHFGFAEDQAILPALENRPELKKEGLDFSTATFFMGRETLVLSPKLKTLPFWQKKIFEFLARNSHDASKYFRIPPGRVVELGIQFEI
jgi:KUP system potassium uptake protein